MSSSASTRRSRHHYVDETLDRRFRALSRRYDLWRQFYTSMLLQDLEHVFPYPRFNRGFTANVDPEGTPSVADLIASALARERRHRRDDDLAEALRDFAEECAPHVVAFGVAAYEVAFTSPDDGKRWEGFRLHLIQPYRKRFGRHQHYLVSEDGRRGRWITIPKQTVVEFRLPRRRRIAAASAMASLAAANANSPIRARLQYVSGLPYSFSRHAAAERELLARATAPIGWRGRGLFTADQLEPYPLIRDLRFEGFQAELRQLILAGVNTAVERAGEHLGFEARVVVDGVPTLDDVYRQTARVQDGVGSEVNLQDVLQPFY